MLGTGEVVGWGWTVPARPWVGRRQLNSLLWSVWHVVTGQYGLVGAQDLYAVHSFTLSRYSANASRWNRLQFYPCGNSVWQHLSAWVGPIRDSPGGHGDWWAISLLPSQHCSPPSPGSGRYERPRSLCCPIHSLTKGLKASSVLEKLSMHQLALVIFVSQLLFSALPSLLVLILKR